MAHVFLNFRGRDQGGYAALLDRVLTAEFGEDAVFLSSRSIKPGDDFVAKLLQLLSTSRVLLAIIGPEWLRYGSLGGNEPGERRPSRPSVEEDWVRLEIATALDRGIRVIPVLVEGASMPRESQLPVDLAALSRCQYLRLHHRNIDHDLARIVEVIADLLPTGIVRRGDDEAAPTRVLQFILAPPARPGCRIGAASGSILQVRDVDVWVNSENTDMDMSRINEFTISGIIRYWAAKRDHTGAVIDDVIARQLGEQVGTRSPVAPGAVFVTGSGALAESHGVRHILHVASVSGEPGAGFRQIRNLAPAVTNLLVEAERLHGTDPQIKTMLIPLLGVGTGGGALLPTVTKMIGAIVSHLQHRPDYPLTNVYLLGYRASEFTAIVETFAADPRLSPWSAPSETSP